MSRAPERIVHLGVGAFFRAHQAWYTSAVDSANEWGIVGYTGRSATVADELRPQDCKYNLVVRGEAEDRVELIESLVRIEAGTNVADLVATVSKPEIALVTMTITEAGYRVTADFYLDESDPDVVHDLAVLSGAEQGGPKTAMGRLALALEGRRLAGAAPIAIVPCDNMPNNGRVAKSALVGFARVMSPETLSYFESVVSYVTTSVDRITPKTTQQDKDFVAENVGWVDNSPVVTEPFHDWVLEGEFPAGRPAWENAGAKFVANIHPFENRKLWLLNGSHSLLAYAGLLNGAKSVSEAIAQPALLVAVNEFWNEACLGLPADDLDLASYRADLLARFSNNRIAHNLIQIATDGATKLSVRVVPTALAQLKAGKSASGCVFAIASWVRWVIQTEDIADSKLSKIKTAKLATNRAQKLIAILSPSLAQNEVFMKQIASQLFFK